MYQNINVSLELLACHPDYNKKQNGFFTFFGINTKRTIARLYGNLKLGDSLNEKLY
jgi:hypothetical protein